MRKRGLLSGVRDSEIRKLQDCERFEFEYSELYKVWQIHGYTSTKRWSSVYITGIFQPTLKTKAKAEKFLKQALEFEFDTKQKTKQVKFTLSRKDIEVSPTTKKGTVGALLESLPDIRSAHPVETEKRLSDQRIKTRKRDDIAGGFSIVFLLWLLESSVDVVPFI